MKRILNIITIMVLLDFGTQAKTTAKVVSINNDVLLEVALDSGMYITPVMTVFEKGYNPDDVNKDGRKQFKAKPEKNGSYVFELKDQRKPLYFSIELPDKLKNITLINKFHFEPGDHILIRVKRTIVPNIYDLEFSGQGSAKYRCRNEFRGVARMEKPIKDKTGDKRVNEILSNMQLMRDLIQKYKPELSEYSFDLLNAEILGGYGIDTMASINTKVNLLIKANDSVGLKKFADNYKHQFLSDFTMNIPEPILIDAKNYTKFLMEGLRTESLIRFGKVDYGDIFQNILKMQHHLLKDKMVMNFMFEYWGKIDDDQYREILVKAVSKVKDPYYLSRINEFQRNLTGKSAYNFSLQDVNGKVVRMQDFKGKVVFIDFWFTGCTFCKRYYSQVLANVEHLYENNSEVIFITVCVDKNKDQWLQSIKGGQYTSSKVINLYTNGDGPNNEIIKYYNILTYPRPMLIGQTGVVLKFAGNELRNKENLIGEIEKALKSNK